MATAARFSVPTRLYAGVFALALAAGLLLAALARQPGYMDAYYYYNAAERLVTGEGREDIASPVGIVQGSSDAAKQSTNNFFWVLGLISLSIALLNLLPFLPLDGGHIVFAIAEGISGKTVPRGIYERVSMVGIGLVLLLFVIGLTNDIGRLS